MHFFHNGSIHRLVSQVGEILKILANLENKAPNNFEFWLSCRYIPQEVSEILY